MYSYWEVYLKLAENNYRNFKLYIAMSADIWLDNKDKQQLKQDWTVEPSIVPTDFLK